MSRYLVYGLVDPRTLMVRYVGKSTSGMRRPRQHCSPSSMMDSTHRTRWIKALLRYHLCYRIVVLEYAKTPDALGALECWWIAYGRACDWPLTNATNGGDGTCGYKHTDETKDVLRQRASTRTYVMSKLHKQRVIEASTGRVKSAAELALMRAAATGRVKSAEELAKMSAASTAAMNPGRRAKIGDQHRGSKHTEETKQRIREVLTGRVVSQETRDKLRRTSTGRVFSVESRRKMSASQLGRKHTALSRYKMRMASRVRRLSEELRAL